MKKVLADIFSDKYVNKAADTDNAVLLLMYRIACPFAVILNGLHLSPNHITTLSLGFSILSFAALVLEDSWVLFSILWGLTVLFDFCDGSVARMTNRVSTSAFRYDHMSDLLKISLVILGVGFRYDVTLIWLLAFSASFLFMYSDALNRELHYAIKLQKPGNDEVPKDPAPRLRNRYRLIAWVVKHEWILKFLRQLQAIFLTINGHTLLLFFLFPIGPKITCFALGYLILIELWAVKSRLVPLVHLRRS